jgi:hypothetical protein
VAFYISFAWWKAPLSSGFWGAEKNVIQKTDRQVSKEAVLNIFLKK